MLPAGDHALRLSTLPEGGTESLVLSVSRLERYAPPSIAQGPDFSREGSSAAGFNVRFSSL